MLLLIIGIGNFGLAQKISSPKPLTKDSILSLKNLEKNKRQIAYTGNDGPFIINDSLLFRVTEYKKLEILTGFNRDSILVSVDNEDKNSFYVALASEYKIPKSIYDIPEKMVVISDIEGNYEAFVSFLYMNKIIDKDHNWIYGNGHLVLNGDFVDRGKNVTQVLWLIYKLDQQAKNSNGQVHFILGNHEILNFFGDFRYNRGKYIKVAQVISQYKNKKQALKYLYSKHSEIGKWLSTKNIIEKIGDYIFVHGGLSPQILDYNLNLQDINNLARSKYYSISPIKNKTLRFLYSSNGPFWYRGLARKKISEKELDNVLRSFDAKKISIGHTPVDTITSSYNGKIINTDIIHGTKKFSGKTFGLFIENMQEFIIDDLCRKTRLKHHSVYKD